MKIYNVKLNIDAPGNIALSVNRGEDIQLKITVCESNKPLKKAVKIDDLYYPAFALATTSDTKITVYKVPNSENPSEYAQLDYTDATESQQIWSTGSETEDGASGECSINVVIPYSLVDSFGHDGQLKFFIPTIRPERVEDEDVWRRLIWFKSLFNYGSTMFPSEKDTGSGGEIPTDPTFSSIKVGNPENPNFEVDSSGNLTAGTGEFENDLLVGGQQVATMQDIPEKSATAPNVLPDYLYTLEFDNDYADVGKAWREENFETIDIGGCSSVRKNNLVGRNYDYTYSDAATFVIKLPNRVVGAGTKYASVGIATLGSHLTKSMIESGEYTDLYKVLPGMTTDGINEKGLQAAIHLVPSDTTKDAGWTGNSMDAFGAVRYVLDTFDNAESAATWISQNVYLPDKYVTETGYSVQYIVSGYNQNTYIVQDGVVYDYGETTGALTNYRLYDAGSLSPEFNRATIGTYDPYGQGVERMSLIQNGLETLSSSDDVALLMESLYFTNAYSALTENPWYSEFVSKESERTLLSPDEDFTAPLAIGRLAYNVRDRFNPSHVEYEGETYDVTTWQTVHTVVYDLEARTLTVRVQEGSEEYTFKSDIEFEMPYIPIPTRTSELINDSGFIDEQGVKKVYNTNNQQYLDSDGKHYQYYSEAQPWTLTSIPEFEDGTLELDEEYLVASDEWSYIIKLVPSDQGEDIVLETFTSQTQLTQFSHYVTYQNVQYIVDGRRIGQGWNKDWEVAKTSDIPTKVSDLTNDSGFITNTVQGIPFSVKNEAGTTTYFSASSNGVYKNGKLIATVDQIKSPYYKFVTQNIDLTTSVFNPNTVYVVESDTSTPSTWTISLNVTQTDYPTDGVMDCVLLVEDLTQIPTTITVGISNGAVPRFFGDTFDALDTTNVPYIITFTVLNWDASAANVFVKIQKQES